MGRECILGENDYVAIGCVTFEVRMSIKVEIYTRLLTNTKIDR
jgi:hypothetical protein